MSEPAALLDDAVEDNAPFDPLARAMWEERLRREKSGKPSAVEIMSTLDDELNRILASQRALIEGSMRVEPYAGEVKKAVIYEHALLLLKNIIQNADKLRPILYPKATRK